MPLETASTIADLVSTNPVGASDTPAALDDHIQLIKKVLKADALVNADIGVNVAAYSHSHTGTYQPLDAELTALAGLTSAANKVPMFSGSGTATLIDFKDEDDMASNSATSVPSQQSVKSYIDSASKITIGTPVASTSGTYIDFNSIPSTVKRINILFSGVSTNGTSNYIVQIGDSGGIETTGYISGASTDGTGRSTSTYGFIIVTSNAAGYLYSGTITIVLADTSNKWVESHVIGEGTTGQVQFGGGYKATSATIDRVRITTVGGTDAFDSGTINISYES